MRSETIDLAVKASELQALSRPRYDDFIAELEKYAEHLTDQLVASPIDTLQHHQGKARALRDLLQILRDARAIADKAKGK